MTPLMPATVAVPVIAFRNATRFTVVVTIDDLFRVTAVLAFVLAKSFGKAFDLTK